MKHRFLTVLCATLALTSVVRAQDDASTLLDGAQKGIEKIKKEMKAQSDTRNQMKELDKELKRISAVQADLAKSLEAVQQARRESEASTARLTDKIQHLSRQVEHLEAEAQECQQCIESMKKAPAAPPVTPTPAAPPAQATPGATPAVEPSPAP